MTEWRDLAWGVWIPRQSEKQRQKCPGKWAKQAQSIVAGGVWWRPRKSPPVLRALNAGQGGVDKLHCRSHEKGYDWPSDEDHERVAEDAYLAEGIGEVVGQKVAHDVAAIEG